MFYTGLRRVPTIYAGGHTTEAITLLSALDPKRYTHRTYLVSEGDTLSAQKAVNLEMKFGSTPQDVRRVLTEKGFFR